MQVHLVDGTYELFRYHYSPANKDPVRGATRGVVASCLMLLEQGATHVAVATDHVIESFRNDLWAGLQGRHRHRPRAEGAVPGRRGRAARGRLPGVGDGRAGGRRRAGRRRAVAAADDAVERVVICTPDKDLGQCVGGKVWQWDRRQDKWFDANGVRDAPRRAPRVDPRPARAGGRRRRRVPGPARLGRQVGGRRARPLGPPRGHPRRPARVGRGRARRRQAQRHARASSSSWRCSSVASPPSRPTPPVGAVAEWEWRGPTPTTSRRWPRSSATTASSRAPRSSPRGRDARSALGRPRRPEHVPDDLGGVDVVGGVAEAPDPLDPGQVWPPPSTV